MNKQQVTDQMGFEVSVPIKPQSIISLVPSQTELLFDLGLEGVIHGITKFCIHPKDKISYIEKVGGTKNFNFDKINAINPDLIIGNKEENYEEGIAKLKQKFPVWLSDITTLGDALSMIKNLGMITGTHHKANALVSAIESAFAGIKKLPAKRVLYFIWKDPYMVAGKGTFINEMLELIGLKNIADAQRYPQLTVAELSALEPEVILLSSEPYPFKAKHFDELHKICPHAEIRLVDGEMFSWYGSRLLHAPAYFNQLSL